MHPGIGLIGRDEVLTSTWGWSSYFPAGEREDRVAQQSTLRTSARWAVLWFLTLNFFRLSCQDAVGGRKGGKE